MDNTKTQQLPERIIKWLHERGIDDIAIKFANLSWDSNRIVIPIFGLNGEFLFNKYRRDPESDEGSKYTYDSGGSVALYNIKDISQPSIIICEGELDALALNSKGFPAVTSTGGAGSFQEEWAPLFKDHEVYICMDNDDAGIKGALKIQAYIPHAEIVWLGDEGVEKDVTDFFVKYGKSADAFKEFLCTSTKIWVPRMPEEDFEKKAELQRFIKGLNKWANEVLNIQRELKNNGEYFRWTEILLDHINNLNGQCKRKLKFMGRKISTGQVNTLKRAKMVPIDNYIEFNSAGMARCLWHEDETPSMHYYRETNTVHCFGCDRNGDVLDVIQQQHNVNLTEAIKIINGKT